MRRTHAVDVLGVQGTMWGTKSASVSRRVQKDIEFGQWPTKTTDFSDNNAAVALAVDKQIARETFVQRSACKAEAVRSG